MKPFATPVQQSFHFVFNDDNLRASDIIDALRDAQDIHGLRRRSNDVVQITLNDLDPLRRHLTVFARPEGQVIRISDGGQTLMAWDQHDWGYSMDPDCPEVSDFQYAINERLAPWGVHVTPSRVLTARATLKTLRQRVYDMGRAINAAWDVQLSFKSMCVAY